jgi:hypothetical protein
MRQNLVAVSGLSGVAQSAAAAESVLNEVGGPMGLAGRMVGFGSDELDAGIPGWAWFLMGAAAGATAAYYLHDKIAHLVEA